MGKQVLLISTLRENKYKQKESYEQQGLFAGLRAAIWSDCAKEKKNPTAFRSGSVKVKHPPIHSTHTANIFLSCD